MTGYPDRRVKGSGRICTGRPAHRAHGNLAPAAVSRALASWLVITVVRSW